MTLPSASSQRYISAPAVACIASSRKKINKGRLLMIAPVPCVVAEKFPGPPFCRRSRALNGPVLQFFGDLSRGSCCGFLPGPDRRSLCCRDDPVTPQGVERRECPGVG